MIIMIVSAGIGILLFLCMFLGFKAGLRLGMQTAKGQAPAKIEPLKSAVQTVANAKQVVEDIKQKGAQNDLLKGWGNMQNFTGEPEKGAQ